MKLEPGVRCALALLLLAPRGAPAAAQPPVAPVTIPAQPSASQPAARGPAPGACLPARVIRGSDLVVLGIYGGGGRRIAYRFDGSRQAADMVAVAGRLSKRTVLIITAYEPTIWDLSGLTGRPVAGVYLAGHYAQGVVGLAPATPVAFRQAATYRGPYPGAADNPCPDLHRAYDRPTAMSTAIRIRQFFGKWPTAFYGSYAPFSFRIGGGPLPPYAAAPEPAAVRSQFPLIPGDADMRRQAEGYDTSVRLHQESELRGRRLLHLRWSRSGAVSTVETERFGEDRWREQISRDD